MEVGLGRPRTRLAREGEASEAAEGSWLVAVDPVPLLQDLVRAARDASCKATLEL